MKVDEKLDIYKANCKDKRLALYDYPAIASALYLRDDGDTHDAAIHCAGVFAGRFSGEFRNGTLGIAMRVDPRLSAGAVRFYKHKYDRAIRKLERSLKRHKESDVQYYGHLLLSIAYSFSNRKDKGYQAMQNLIAAGESLLTSNNGTEETGWFARGVK